MDAARSSRDTLAAEAREITFAMTNRFYKVAFLLSALLNVLLVAGFWYYQSVEGMLGLVQTMVSIFN